VTRCRHHLFFRTPLRAVAVTPAQRFGPTYLSWLAVPPRGPSRPSSTATCSVAVIQAHQPKQLPFGFNFAPTTYLRTDLRRSVQDPLCLCYFPRKYLHAACVWPMWRAGMSIWHDHVHQTKSWLAGEKRPGNPRRPHKTSTAQQLAARDWQPPSAAWSRGLY
jgi:hypothetical protein